MPNRAIEAVVHFSFVVLLRQSPDRLVVNDPARRNLRFTTLAVSANLGDDVLLDRQIFRPFVSLVLPIDVKPAVINNRKDCIVLVPNRYGRRSLMLWTGR